jgi:hypothetical protein|tara:strand:- start:128 stop:310 length:183 start_codon:yes stop_codon:yes gene_type:complete
MKYTKGDLVLVQTSYNTDLRKKYAIVQSQFFNSIKVKFMQTGEVKSYLKDFITPVTAEKS